MSERGCELGCKVPAEHWAACPWYSIEESEIPSGAEVSPLPVCRGCVPVPARDGVLICDRCYRRMRGHIDNAADLVGRLRSLADPRKAMVYDAVRSSSGKGVEAPAPTPADLIDASEDVMRSLRSWAVFVDPRSGLVGGMPAGAGSLAAYDYARRCANVVLGDFDQIANNAEDVRQLAEAVLERHPVDEDGVRSFWSIADATARFRLERIGTDHTHDAEADLGADDTYEVSGVVEWRDRLITRADAVRTAGSESTLLRWRKREGLTPRAITNGPMGRVVWFRESDVLAVRDRVRQRVRGRRGPLPDGR